MTNVSIGVTRLEFCVAQKYLQMRSSCAPIAAQGKPRVKVMINCCRCFNININQGQLKPVELIFCENI